MKLTNINYRFKDDNGGDYTIAFRPFDGREDIKYKITIIKHRGALTTSYFTGEEPTKEVALRILKTILK